ncbi:Protein unc-45-like protein [Lachnellula subtilissima]|uniref:Protein unc-45-like protein n=1 Tax=Lachnellula subtilissima TaxID=602034 RepID=A0A8H8RPM9_9HELO|nr:Protein unc-45-like protein [Lachnellula subtilissima]
MAASSADSRLFEFLQQQKSKLEEARKRTGEIPRDRDSRRTLIGLHLAQDELMKEDRAAGKQKRLFTIIGDPYLPSAACHENLQKIFIKDLQLETHHRGRYMLLRCAVPPIRQNAIISVVEDETGDASTFSLYQQEPEHIRPAGDILKENSVLLLKEPYFKVTAGGYGLRVDHPTDVMWLVDHHPKVPNAWRKSHGLIGKTVEELKTEGNSYFLSGKYTDAIKKYSQASSSGLITPEEDELVHNNRALCHLKLGKYDAALKDASFIANHKSRSDKAHYRGALALYGLGNFEESIVWLNRLIESFPESVAAKQGRQELERVKLRVEEQKTGKYNWKKMYRDAKLGPVDCATYDTPVEVRQVEGKGRGLFTNKSVKCGDLLACEKAFSYICASEKDSPEMPAAFGALINLTTNRVKIGTDAAHISNVYQKLIDNPSCARLFLDSYPGTYEPGPEMTEDGVPIVDSFLIERIVSLNAFGCPLTSKDQELSKKQAGEISTSSGIWPLAAYINHSCIANCARTFIGDMMVCKLLGENVSTPMGQYSNSRNISDRAILISRFDVQIMRATQDIPRNTEITWCYHDPTNRADLQKSLLENWGFKCTCPVCTEEGFTGKDIKSQRNKYLAILDSTHKAGGPFFDQLNQLYGPAAKEVPRFELFLACYKAAMYWLLSDFNLTLVLMFTKKALEALGFGIEGIDESRGGKLVVRKRGIAVPELPRLW